MQLSVLKEYAQPIPSLLEVVEKLRSTGIKSVQQRDTSHDDGYPCPGGNENGYEPDCIVCPDEVPAGRPYPWMCDQNAIQLGVYPLQTMVKVGDTLPDIEEGLNAGMWTVSLALTRICSD